MEWVTAAAEGGGVVEFDAGGNRMKQTSSLSMSCKNDPSAAAAAAAAEAPPALSLLLRQFSLAMLDLLFLMHYHDRSHSHWYNGATELAGDRMLIGIGGDRTHGA